MATPPDYEERVYAGVLGKIIGVYLGRPFEGWTYERISAELGEIHYYVHHKLNKPLIVTDDDISGTFTFLRALPDYGNGRDLSPQQIGQTWLNYIIEERTILWWGGLGNSTEHTAYLRLKNGITAPRSGSMALNGRIVAEQIGAQIFIDGWAMVAPGDPEMAADLARRAASVSHDGEAIYGAQLIAAMEAQAFVEADIHKVLDTGLALIPRDATIYRLVSDVRQWHAGERDWRRTRANIAAHYGYDKYKGNVHIVPNHALVILGLLYGEDNLQRSLMITNTSGWDTDCNSGNVGCLLGIKNGLAGLDAGPDWRGPVADQLYLPTADGGRAITDAVSETYHIVNIGRALAGARPVAAKEGARFHFDLPGAVQGFRAESDTVALENVAGHSQLGRRSLAIRYRARRPGQAGHVATPTFIPPEASGPSHYALLASPTLYPGQKVRARVAAGETNPMPVAGRLFLRVYGAEDELATIYGPEAALEPGAEHDFAWRIGDTGGAPIAQIGLAVSSPQPGEGTLYLDYLTWDGVPSMTLSRPTAGGMMWRRAWVNGVDHFEPSWPEAYRLSQNRGVGLLIQGERTWLDYEVSAVVASTLAAAIGIGARVQGMRRYYALLLSNGGKARLVKALDGYRTLAEQAFPWEFGRTYELHLAVVGTRLRGWIDGRLLFDVADRADPLTGGGLALVCEEGCLSCNAVMIRPVL